MNKIRYFNENVGPLKENEIKAFQKSIELSREIENIDEITLIRKIILAIGKNIWNRKY